MIPITIITGFLGSGKTTLINQIISQNRDIKFGFIINEFGEVGIDGQLIEAVNEQDPALIELSNGCICCLVRGDLLVAAKKIIESNRIDYLIIETSGLAEPLPVAETFAYNNLDNKIKLDAIVCLIDCENFVLTEQNYKVMREQIISADIILLNKIETANPEALILIKEYIKKLNPYASVIENTDKVDTRLVIDTELKKQQDISQQDSNDHDHHDTHEHENIDEIVFTTKRLLDPEKIDNWVKNNFPSNIVRAKGFLKFDVGMHQDPQMYLFQIVGGRSNVTKFDSQRNDFDTETSRIVLIGKNLNKDKLLNDLKNCEI